MNARSLRRLACVVWGLSLVGCGGGRTVVRVYEGKIVEGRYIAPEAYAAYLRGVLAEEDGDLEAAAKAFADAASRDDADPEVWARLGAVRCKKDPRDPRADEAFERAKKVDPQHAGQLAARAVCAIARGREADARADAAAAATLDPKNVEFAALLVKLDAKRSDPEGRARAVELTRTYGERAAAWDALIAWGQGHGDAELVARGFEGLVRAAPNRALEVERGAVKLMGEGRVDLARRVAATLADVPREYGILRPHDPAVGRLAIDEALARGDEAAAVRRAVRVHVSLPEVAARASALGSPDVAASIARAVMAADPDGAATRALGIALGTPDAEDLNVHDVPIVCLLAAALARPERARGWLAGLGAPEFADPIADGYRVELAARGLLGIAALGAPLAVELAARRHEAPPDGATALDARHDLLRRALVAPTDAETKRRAAWLAGGIAHDESVAFAVARVARAETATAARRLVFERLVASTQAATPLTLAAALAVSPPGEPRERVLKTRLSALARTDAERRLAVP